ncbi:invasion associated locus B family protein [Aquibium microcysteis]|uniref:invasion associated locus B family protein n=1 Tax=Aquibium microcysteis TaxID=675281 RepID=UPI00165CEEE9|nr:invasion associated locus B family protein [Aquibium microcysteis]
MRGALALLLSVAVHAVIVGMVVFAGVAGTGWSVTGRLEEMLASRRDQIVPAPPPGSPGPDAGAGRSAAAAQPSASASASAGEPAADRFTSFGDWRYGCSREEAGKPSVCSISQRLVGAGSKTPLLVWQLLQDGKGGIVSLIRTPTDIAFDRGVVLVLTPGTEHVVPYSACFTGGCIARADLAPETRKALSQAEHIALMVFSADGRGVPFAISTKGLAEGLAALPDRTGGGT